MDAKQEYIFGQSLIRYLELQKRIDCLLSNLNNSESIEHMLEMLEEEIHLPIGILEYDGKLIGLSDIKMQFKECTEDYYNNIIEQALIRNDIFLNISNRQYQFYVKALGMNANQLNFLLVDQSSQQLELYDKRILDYAIPIISIQLKNNQTLQNKIKKYRDRFLLDWAKGVMEDTMDILLFAKEYDFNLNKDNQYQVGIISVIEVEKYYREVCILKMKHFVQSLKSEYLITFDGGELLIIMEIQQYSDSISELKKLTKDLENAIGVKVKIALSNPQPINHVSAAYKEARKIYEISKKLEMKKSIITFEDLGVFTILSLLPQHEEVNQYVERNLNSIKEYDKKNNSKLLETLSVYFSTGKNARKSSEVLYIHYNTMMYRLDKIKTILNKNIDDVEIQLQLQLALKIDAMYHKEL